MWTAKPIALSHPPANLHDLVALEYSGHDPYSREVAHEDFEKCYGITDGDIGSGLIGYFPEALCDQIRHALNFIFPPYDEGWRWQTFDLMDEGNFNDLRISLLKGVTGIYDPAGELQGYMLDKPNCPGVYAVLAVLNQGPVPSSE